MLQPSGESDVAKLIATEALQKATTHALPAADLFAAAERLKALGQAATVVQLYKTWIAFNPTEPVLFAVYFNYAVALTEVVDTPGAINAMRESIRLKPDFYPPYINLGRVLEDNNQLVPALEVWNDVANRLGAITGEALAHRNTVLQQIGRVLEGAGDPGGAETALRQSLDLNPAHAEVVQHWISLRQAQCKWPVIEPWERVSRKALLTGIAPLSLANMADDPLFQLAKACHFNRRSIGVPDVARRKPRRDAPFSEPARRLRIGYVSSDFREHAVGFAMTDVMETHDRGNCEIFAYYCGIARVDATQVRIRAAVDHWIDLNDLSDDAAAQQIVSDSIDILVDLNGYTKFARNKLFALRPAPILVNWFGFPGTMGSPYHHYLIADSRIIPEDHEIFYSETVLRLPCYQPNDRKRVVSPVTPSRAEEKLPDGVMVYCCLNGMQKLTPVTFERWMTILKAVPQSVLWLLAGNGDTNERVRQRAAELGVAPERLIFADKKANADHLARYPLADLFLDTMPYGAHTTAADSLWMGVPIVTLSGRSFASRVCGSIVAAAGLPDMVCTTPEDYVARAIELGREPGKLAETKQRLVENRDTCLLFDTPTLVRELEALYRTMWQDFATGRRPVPDLTNLELYHEIGVELGIETMELLTRDSYEAAYRQKLADLHDFAPFPFDPRLWPATA